MPANAADRRLATRWRAAFTVAILLSLGTAMFGAKHRIPWSDEGWFSSASYNLAKHGFMGTTVLDSSSRLTRIEQRTYWVMPLYLLGQAAWYVVFPVTLLSTRAFNIPWALLALAANYVFLVRLLGRREVAALATILLALSFLFIDNTGFARPDIMCVALGLAGLAGYLSYRETSLIRALLVGNGFVAAALFTHPNGIFHCVGLAALVLYFDRRRLTIGAIAVSAVPYLFFGACWSIYILQDSQAFIDQMTVNGTNGRWSKTLNPVKVIWGEIYERYFVAFGLVTRGLSLLKAYALVAYVAGCVGVIATASLRRQRGIRVLLVLTGLYFVALSVFNQKLSYYLVHIIPFYIALLAAWLWHLWVSGPTPLRAAVVLGAGVLMLVETAGVIVKSRQRSYIAAEQKLVSFVRAHASTSGPIVGTAALLYGFDFDPRLLDDMYLGLRSGRVPDTIIIDQQLYQPTYDGWLKQRPEDMKRIMERLGEYRRAYDDGAYRVYIRSDQSLESTVE